MVAKLISKPVVDYQKLFSEMAVALREMEDIGTVASADPLWILVALVAFGAMFSDVDLS